MDPIRYIIRISAYICIRLCRRSSGSSGSSSLGSIKPDDDNTNNRISTPKVNRKPAQSLVYAKRS